MSSARRTGSEVGRGEAESDAKSGARGRLEMWDPVGEHEVAEILGVIQQRVVGLERARAAGGRSGFPAPVKRLASGPLWDRLEIEKFRDHRRRQAGAPPGTTRRPRPLAGYADEDIQAAVNEAEAGLSEREREVLGMRLGEKAVGGEAGGGPLGVPLGQQAIAEQLNISVAAVKKAQKRAVDKVLAVVEKSKGR